MSATGLEVFDKTLQTTNIWLGEITEITGPDRHLAWKALSSVLHSLRDRLPTNLSAHLGAQLPLLVRGAYYDQYEPDKQPRDYDYEGFLKAVGAQMEQARPTDTGEVASAVFQTLSRHVPEGQITKIQNALPEDIRRVWKQAEERIVPPPDSGAGRRRGEAADEN